MKLLDADTEPLLRIVTCDADELAALEHDFLGDIFDARLTGLLVRAAFPPSAMARVVERLESGACDHIERASQFWQGRAIGPSLQYAAPDLRGYFEEVRAFRADVAALFKGGPDFHIRIEDLLTRAHAGRPLSIPRGPRGEQYAVTTIRGLVPGSTMHPHCDLGQYRFPAIRHLASQFDPSAMLSYLLVLSNPERGGELHVYNLRCDDDTGRDFARMDLASEEALRAAAAHGELVLPMMPGDLLVFDAGRYFHCVDHVGGSRTRWSQGGFLSRSCDATSMFYWH